jgi:hypothetical protein
LPHESGVMPLRLRLGAESIAVKVPARLSLVGLLLLLLTVFCSFRLPDAWSVAFFSF